MSDDIHALSGAYAVDALDDAERAAFEEHLAVCPACQNEVASLREGAALLAETETTLAQPAPELRERVLAGITMVRPLPPLVAQAATELSAPAEVPTQAPSEVAAVVRTEAPAGLATVTPIHRRRRAVTFLAAAAAVVAIGSGGLVWHSMNDSNGPSQSYAAPVIGASDRIVQTETLDNGATATLYRSPKLDRAVLVTKGMPAVPAGHKYVVWLQQGTVMTPAAVMSNSGNGTVVLGGDANDADGLGITVEDADVTPTTPSTDIVGVFPFRSA
jgi:anti-sigma factor RsiW